MRVLVLWEDPGEQAEAENLAKVLTSISPQLAGSTVDKYGGVAVRHSPNQALPNVRVRAMSLRDAPPATPEHAAYVEALERAVFKVDEPQRPEVVFTEYRICQNVSCSREHEFQAASQSDLDRMFRWAGWHGYFCPTHASVRVVGGRGGQ